MTSTDATTNSLGHETVTAEQVAGATGTRGEGDILLTAGWLHDIGYTAVLEDTGFTRSTAPGTCRPRAGRAGSSAWSRTTPPRYAWLEREGLAARSSASRGNPRRVRRADLRRPDGRPERAQHDRGPPTLGVDKNTTVVFPAPLMCTIGELGSFLARENAAAKIGPATPTTPVALLVQPAVTNGKTY
ncbi:hypothetical protein BJ973_005858 [Actinoplanes tereljensis]|nr:hypothetical protein [Actinoplanes tereljensis]